MARKTSDIGTAFSAGDFPDGTLASPAGSSRGGGKKPSGGGTLTGTGTMVAGGTFCGAVLEKGSVLRLGETDYEVVSHISSGAEADIYLVESANGRYAAKLYARGHAPDSDVLRKLSGISGTGSVVSLISFGNVQTEVAGTVPYTLMPYYSQGSVAGHDFSGDAEGIKSVVSQVAQALDSCHRQGIIHKDIKPANIFFLDRDAMRVAVGDFGIAANIGEDGHCYTEQSRTVVYAAPEIYSKAALVDGVTYCDISPKADFFSLGMTVLAMWYGENEFRKKESELALTKARGIDIPEDFPESLAPMVKGLTIPDPSRRWGLPEIETFLSGGEVETYVDDIIPDFHIVYNARKKQIARSTKELAAFLLEDEDLGIKYLYRGKVNEWLKRDRPELDIAIADVIELKYPRDGKAGLYAAALILDPSLPVKGESGKTYGSVEDCLLAEYAFYSSDMENLSSIPYVFLEARKGADFVRKCHDRFMEARNDGFGLPLDRVLLMLGKGFSFKLEGRNNETGETESHSCSDLSEIAGFCSSHSVLEESSVGRLCSLAFLDWAENFDPSVPGRAAPLRKALAGNGNALYRCMVQTVNPLSDIALSTDMKDGNYAMTGESIGRFINDVFLLNHVLYRGDTGKLSEDFAAGGYRSGDDALDERMKNVPPDLVGLICSSFRNYGNSYLQMFFRTKGDRFSQQDRWASFCTEFNSRDNRNKYSPYNGRIAMLKTVCGFGYRPEYVFPGCGKTADSPAALDKVPSKEVAEELRNGCLKDWLAVQYQENPDEKLKNKFDFEKLVQKYIEKIGSYDPSDREYSRYKSAADQVRSFSGTAAKSAAFFGLQKFAAAAFGALPMLLVLAALIFAIIRDPLVDMSGLKFGNFFYVLALILAGIAFFSFDDGGCLGALIAGAVVSGLIFLLVKLLAQFILILLALLVLVLLIWLSVRTVFYRNSVLANIRRLKAPGFEEAVLEPLHFAFKSGSSSFDSSLSLDYDSIRSEVRGELKRKWILTAIFAGAAFLFCFLLIKLMPGTAILP